MKRRRLAALLILLPLLAVEPAGSQVAAPRPFAHGIDYAFQRIQTSVSPAGAKDQGSFTLISYAYVPLKSNRHEAVVLSHGSTGGGALAAGEPVPVARPVVEFFVSRGYTVVVPMRRGRGESGGTYGEDCVSDPGAPTLAELTARYECGLDQAVADTAAVLDQSVLGPLVPKDARVVFAGISRGGFLSLVMAARRPQTAKGVVNFVGAWLWLRDQDSAELNQMRLKLQTDRLASLAQAVRVPTLWIYAARDPNYTGTATRQLFDAFAGAGGKGEYFFVESHGLPSGHLVATNGALWRQPMEAFVRGLDAPGTATPR